MQQFFSAAVFGRVLKRCRLDLGLTQQQLAGRARRTQSWVTQTETCKTTRKVVRARTFDQAAKALGMPPEALQALCAEETQREAQAEVFDGLAASWKALAADLAPLGVSPEDVVELVRAERTRRRMAAAREQAPDLAGLAAREAGSVVPAGSPLAVDGLGRVDEP